MTQHDEPKQPVNEMARKLETEISELEIKQDELKSEFDQLQFAHQEIHSAQQEVKAEYGCNLSGSRFRSDCKSLRMN